VKPVDELHDHDRGLSHDLPILLSRRRALALLGGAGLVATGCSTQAPSSATSPDLPGGNHRPRPQISHR